MPDDAESLIETLRQANLLDAPLEAAFRAIPRAAFLPDLPPDEVYKDEALPTKVDADGTVLSSSSQPSMMAIMLRQLDVQPGMNVLEIGTGTGYNAALMQCLVGAEGKVTTVEIDSEVVERARANLQRVAMSEVLVVEGDGAQGFAPRASYDRIMVTAGVWDVPEAWVRQMKPKSILVAPLWLEGFEISAALRPQPDGSLFSGDNRLCAFIPLRGQAAAPETAVRIGTSGLYVNAGEKFDTTALQMLLSDDAEDNYLGVAFTPSEYWHSFLTYLILHVPDEFILARYAVTKDAPAYGLSGHGFALMTQGSVCFVGVGGRGAARNFGSADALLAAQDVLAAWQADRKPRQEGLRLRLVPHGSFEHEPGKRFQRREHDVLAWLEAEGGRHG